jgi:hypothetical protein
VRFAALLRILGVRELARRLGVKPSTVERWIRAGRPSDAGRERLKEVSARRRAGFKSVETKKKRKAFRETLVMPVHPSAASSMYPFATGYLDEDQVLPTKKPVETQAELARIRRREGHDGGGLVDTDRFTGESVWLSIGAPLLEVDIPGLIDDVTRIWQDSGRTWAHVLLMLFRYIPFNPFYTGEMIRKQGRWVDFWVQSHLCATINAIAMNIQSILASSFRAAETRLIWFEAAKIKTFDSKGEIPNYKRGLRRQLRTT